MGRNKKVALSIIVITCLVILGVIIFLGLSAFNISKNMANVRSISKKVSRLNSERNIHANEVYAKLISELDENEEKAYQKSLEENSSEIKKVDEIINLINKEIEILGDANSHWSPRWYKEYLSKLDAATRLHEEAYKKEKDMLNEGNKVVELRLIVYKSSQIVPALRQKIEGKEWSLAANENNKLKDYCTEVSQIVEGGIDCSVVDKENKAIDDKNLDLAAKYWFELSPLFSNNIDKLYIGKSLEKTVTYTKEADKLSDEAIEKENKAKEFYNNGGNMFSGRIFVFIANKIL